MAKKRATKNPEPETLEDLLRPLIESRELTEKAEEHGLHARTLHRVRMGETAASAGTIALIALMLGVPVDRVRKAIAASRS